MKFYKLIYWDSHTGHNDILVIAKNKKTAIKLAVRECSITNGEQLTIRIKSVNKDYPKGLVIL